MNGPNDAGGAMAPPAWVNVILSGSIAAVGAPEVVSVAVIGAEIIGAVSVVGVVGGEEPGRGGGIEIGFAGDQRHPRVFQIPPGGEDLGTVADEGVEVRPQLGDAGAGVHHLL